ncbi:hypothetical protein DVR12_21725 [Chitinophaga silvatica]|uniref:YCII-related domain-containing protein n=1 Tax=Chitinophaga silvatica TaxID=2282649 RepID=A0A3E1Y4T3_9BACT|nr:YciI family protein [Chitinophaga silvatica]RFS19720.1 hypothetical protein DVR12_21725 [Chitinophaga silvatica]
MASKIIPALMLLGFVIIVMFTFHTTPIKSIASSIGSGTFSSISPTLRLKQYWMVFFKKGPAYQNGRSDSLQQAHIRNIEQLVKVGKLVVAGPFTDDGELRGIFIMDCKDSTEVISLVSKDPAVIMGKLTFEIKPWLTNGIGQ